MSYSKTNYIIIVFYPHTVVIKYIVAQKRWNIFDDYNIVESPDKVNFERKNGGGGGHNAYV